jgi:outer membrane protein OmpA-like peptidoglycan-associated protein
LIFTFSMPLFGQDTLSVFFDHDEWADFNANVLDEHAGTLPLLDGIRIIGYADATGDSGHNLSLSKQRAESVASYLYMQGVPRRHVAEVLGMGQVSALAGPNARNRRVDVIIPSEDKPSKESPKVEPEQQTIPGRKAPPEPKSFGVFEIDTLAKTNIVLSGLSFIPGRHFPTPESMPELYKLVETLKTYPEMEIEIQGHICCEYDEFDGLDIDTQEKTLSKNRAEYVYKFLIQNGIHKSRLAFVGKGSSEPKIFPERSEEDMQANRRVEIKITVYP